MILLDWTSNIPPWREKLSVGIRTIRENYGVHCIRTDILLVIKINQFLPGIKFYILCKFCRVMVRDIDRRLNLVGSIPQL